MAFLTIHGSQIYIAKNYSDMNLIINTIFHL